MAVFDYYSYATDQATTLGSMVGVAKDVMAHRQQNQLIRQQHAMMQAEFLMDQRSEELAHARDMEKELLREQGRQHRHDQRMALDTGKFQYGVGQDQMKFLQDQAQQNWKTISAQVDAFYKTNEDFFRASGFERPFVRNVESYDEEDNFQGWQTVVQGPVMYDNDGNPFRSNLDPASLGEVFNDHIAAYNRIKDYLDNRDILAQHPDEAIDGLSQQEVDQLWQTSQDTSRPEAQRAAIFQLLTSPLAERPEESDKPLHADQRRAKATIDGALSELSALRELSQTDQARGFRRGRNALVRLFNRDFEDGAPVIDGVPMSVLIENVRHFAEVAPKDLPEEWSRQRIENIAERLERIVQDNLIQLVTGESIQPDKFGFFYHQGRDRLDVIPSEYNILTQRREQQGQEDDNPEALYRDMIRKIQTGEPFGVLKTGEQFGALTGPRRDLSE